MDFKKLFIYANSYSARMLIFHAEYLFNCKIMDIYILRENHNDNEHFSISPHINLTLCNSIHDAVKQSDITIVLFDKNVPQDMVNNIRQLSDKLGKKCIVINDVWNTERLDRQQNNLISNTILDYSNTPVVLSLSVGQFTGQYCVELLLNKIFLMQG